MSKRDMGRMSLREIITLGALIDEAVGKCGPDAVSGVLNFRGVNQVEEISADDYWDVVSELQLLCSDS